LVIIRIIPPFQARGRKRAILEGVVEMRHNEFEHNGNIFNQVEERLFAYQDEWLSGGGWIEASESKRPERYRYIDRADVRKFDLFFRHHTNHAVQVTLEVRRHDDKLIHTFEFCGSFAELCNRIFGPGCNRYEEPICGG
jgi:hypothetical protein